MGDVRQPRIDRIVALHLDLRQPQYHRQRHAQTFEIGGVILDVHVDLAFDLEFEQLADSHTPLGVFDILECFERTVQRRTQVAGDAANAQAVPAVGRQFDFDQVVVEQRILRQRLPYFKCSDAIVERQNTLAEFRQSKF